MSEARRETRSDEMAAGEVIRDVAEGGRINAETLRQAAEAVRVDAEVARQAREDARRYSEEARVHAEDAREAAERARRDHESVREALVDQRAVAAEMEVTRRHIEAITKSIRERLPDARPPER